MRQLAATMLSVAAAAALVQAQNGEPPRLAFRIDDRHVMVTMRTLNDESIRQFTTGEANPSMAKYGYPFVDLPSRLEKLAGAVAVPEQWTLHTAVGQRLRATKDRFVLGQGQCESLLGLVLKIDPEDAEAFRAVRAKYYVADANAIAAAGEPSTVGELPASAITPAMHARLERALNDLMRRGLPAVQKETADAIARDAASDVGYHRTWARERQAAQNALSRGAAALRYDAQAYVVSPDRVPYAFVRAKWMAGTRQAFAAAAWIRTDSGVVVWSSLRPAAWLRMFEFQGNVHPEQLGLILNVVDRDRDGWAEVIFMQAGYEGLSVQLHGVTSSRIEETAESYGFGC